MTIRLPEEVERSIMTAVQSGQFSSATEAVTEAWLAFAREHRSATPPQALTPADIHRQMLAEGLLTHLPDTVHDTDDDDDEPIIIEGEPLSATIIRERR